MKSNAEAKTRTPQKISGPRNPYNQKKTYVTRLADHGKGKVVLGVLC